MDALQYFENILPLMDSLWCTLQKKVNIMRVVSLLGVRDVFQDGRQDGRHLGFY